MLREVQGLVLRFEDTGKTSGDARRAASITTGNMRVKGSAARSDRRRFTVAAPVAFQPSEQ